MAESQNWFGWPFKILRQSSRNIPHIIFFLSQDSIKMATEAGTESNFRVPFLSDLYPLSVRRILSASNDYRGSTRWTRSVRPSAASARHSFDFFLVSAHWGRFLSGRLAKGHVSVFKSFNLLRTSRRTCGTNPFLSPWPHKEVDGYHSTRLLPHRGVFRPVSADDKHLAPI